MSALVCDVCGSSRMEEDDSGHMACLDCGTQSQQLFAESNEAADMGNGDFIRTIRRPKGPVAVQSEYKPTVMDALTAFQGCLQILAEGIQGCFDLPGSYVGMVRQLWLSYLRRWAESSRYSILEAFYFRIHQSNRRKKLLSETLPDTRHLTVSERVLPSPPLMLAICMLASYMQRLDLLPVDIQKLVLNGNLPYFNLYDTLHVAYQKKVEVLKPFFVESKAPSVDLIQYLALTLLKELKLKAPPLNEPVIAQRMVSRLGFPGKVFKAFMRGREHLRWQSSASGGGAGEELAYELILAKVVIAVKSAMNVAEVRYLAVGLKDDQPASQLSSENVAYEMPRDLRSLDLIPRSQLSKYLERFRRLYCKPGTAREKRTGIYRFADEQLDFIANRTRDQFSNELRPCKTFMHPVNPYYLTLPKPLQAVHRKGFKRSSQNFPTQTILWRSAPGYFHPAYVFLTEYCAHAFGVEPRLLHDLMCVLEKNLHDAHRARRSKSKVRATQRDRRQIEQRKVRMSIERMKHQHITQVKRRIHESERRKYYARMLPAMRELAMRGVLHDQVPTQQPAGRREAIDHQAVIAQMTSDFRNTFVDLHENLTSAALDVGLTQAQRRALQERIRERVAVLEAHSTAWKRKRQEEQRMQDDYLMRGALAASTLYAQTADATGAVPAGAYTGAASQYFGNGGEFDGEDDQDEEDDFLGTDGF